MYVSHYNFVPAHPAGGPVGYASKFFLIDKLIEPFVVVLCLIVGIFCFFK